MFQRMWRSFISFLGRIKEKIKEKLQAIERRIPLKKPEIARVWTIIFFGERGGGKTLHQSKDTHTLLRYLTALYTRYPLLHKAIVMTNQHLSKKIMEDYAEFCYHWDTYEELRLCPRKNCWRGKKPHNLHGAYIMFNDISIILDPRNWQFTPDWLKDYFILGRHYGLHILASLVNPENVDIAFRRCVDVGYQFTKLWGTPDPDETQPALKRIWGVYRRRRVEAKMLWRQGNLPEQTIRMILMEKEERDKALKEAGKEKLIVDDTNWVGSLHLFTKTGRFLWWGRWFNPVSSTEIYDTLEDVIRSEPKGYVCTEYKCIDENHVHPWDRPDVPIAELKKEENFCNYKKRTYDLV